MTELDRTNQEMVLALLNSSGDERIGALVVVALDLLVEVEALREVVMRLSAGAISDPSMAPYLAGYRETAFLSHNSAGPSSGLEKVIARFYPKKRDPDGRTWREGVLLERLGMAEAEFEAYKARAKEAEYYT